MQNAALAVVQVYERDKQMWSLLESDVESWILVTDLADLPFAVISDGLTSVS